MYKARNSYHAIFPYLIGYVKLAAPGIFRTIILTGRQVKVTSIVPNLLFPDKA